MLWVRFICYSFNIHQTSKKTNKKIIKKKLDKRKTIKKLDKTNGL